MQPNNCLYVTRDETTSGRGQWWCVWAIPGDHTFVGAEGYCSRRMFRTRREATAYGARHFGGVPTYWSTSALNAPQPATEKV